MKWLISFVKESWSELTKLVWPTGEQIVCQTRRVLLSVVLAALFFGLVNYVLFLFIEFLF